MASTASVDIGREGLRGLVGRLAQLPDQGLLRYVKGALVETPYPQLHADVRAAGRRLRDAGISPRMRVGLLGENSYEWIVHELALLERDVITITFPLEEFLDRAVGDLQREFGLHALLVSPRERRRRGCDEPWLGTLSFDADEMSALANPAAEDLPELPDDVFTMSFSSGTTGRLKCITLGLRGTEDLVRAYHEAFPFRSDDAILVVLPLSAFQQRLMVYAAIWHGFDMHLVDVKHLMRGLREMRPTILAGPPVFYEMLENRFRSLPRAQRGLLLTAGRALRLLPQRVRRPAARRVFAPFHDAYGGRIRLMLSGAAASRMSTLRLFRLLDLPLVQAYGLTETGFISWNLPGRNRLGSVGKLVFPGTVRLLDDGEIVVRYPNPQSHGYFPDSPKGDGTFLADGWLATGDIGRFDDDGYLYIAGRKKEIIITRGGYKLQPEPIEQRFADHPAVGTAVLVGGDDLEAITAVIALRPQASPRDEEAIRELLAVVNAELPSAARVQRLVLTRAEFAVENGLLTNNLKVDRRAVARRFGAGLDALDDGDA